MGGAPSKPDGPSGARAAIRGFFPGGQRQAASSRMMA
jgi:hypothetical protein